MVKIIRWSARVIMILAFLFMMMFSMDAFEGDKSLPEKLGGFLIHNIPVFFLAVLLALAWKRELWGGILITAVSVFLMMYFHSFTTNKGSLVVIAPFLLAGILFILCHISEKRKLQPEP